MFERWFKRAPPPDPISPDPPRPPIFDAVLRSDHDGMRTVLAAQRPALDVYDHLGMTPLLWAVWRGDTEAVRLLLEAGADPNYPEKGCSVETPLWYAAEDFGLPEVAQLLRDYGAKAKPSR